MADTYQYDDSGHYLRGDDGHYFRAEECCCDEPCDCEAEGASPTIDDVSYYQTGDDPCCYNFSASATAGTCGEITAWLWDFDDGTTSSSQNPSHCYEGTGPWSPTLTVTDEAGCQDSVQFEVTCAEIDLCAGSVCGYPTNSVATVEASYEDKPGDGYDCSDCTSLSGIVLTLPKNVGGASANQCRWHCDPNPSIDPALEHFCEYECGDFPEICTAYPATAPPGFPTKYQTIPEAFVTVEWHPGTSTYSIKLTWRWLLFYQSGGDPCGTDSLQYVRTTWQLTGLTSCPHGEFSLPFVSHTISGGGTSYCQSDETNATVVLP